MMRITLLRAVDREAAPWKNGGGLTEEIAVNPPGAGYEDFLWRASIATISDQSDFSLLPGVRRLFCTLKGRLSMTIGGEHREVSPGDAPIAFDGEVPVSAEPLEGQARDFNLMMRAGCFGVLRRCRESSEVSGDQVLLVATRETKITIGESSWSLGGLDVLSIQHAHRCSIYLSEPLLVAEILIGHTNMEDAVGYSALL